MIKPLYTFPDLRPICPIDWLPEPMKSAALYAIQENEIPPAIALTDVISAVGAVVHCGYDCLTPDGEPMPATINTCVVAPSATGKGRSMQLFFAHFLKAQKERQPRIVARDDYGRPIKTPRAPKVEVMMNKPSYRALMDELDGKGMNVTIQREEGNSFLKTDLFKKNTDALTQLWSGDPPLDHFVHGHELIAADARGSLAFRIQPEPMYDFLKRNGRLTYKLGFWPRTIAGCHDPERFPWNETYRPHSMSAASPEDFHCRMSQLAETINDRHKSGFVGRFRVALSLEAKAFMLELRYHMKHWLTTYYPNIREAAGRAWENTLRIAVVLHVFCGEKNEVPRDMCERAWAIVEWSLSQHRLIFVEAIKPSPKPVKPRPIKPPKLPPHQQKLNADMQFMIECIAARSYHHPNGKVPQTEAGLMTGFTATRFCKALGWLVTARLVHIEGHGENATISLLAPQYINLAFGYPTPTPMIGHL